MSSIYEFETRTQRIQRMMHDNPNKSPEMCIAVVDSMWDVRRAAIYRRIPKLFADASLEDLGYDKGYVLEGLEKIFSPTRQNNISGLVFCGPAGSGKTHAAFAVIKHIAEQNPEMVAYMSSYPKTVQSLRNEFSNDSYLELGSTWDKLNNASGMYNGLIFLDDVSAQKQTDFEVDKLSLVLDHRMNHLMPFLLTTNINPDDFKGVFGERLASRFYGYCDIVEFQERDKRNDEHTDSNE